MLDRSLQLPTPALDTWSERTPTGQFTPTDCIGPYAVVRHLATGGMADLHLARPLRDPDTLVVIKQIRPEYASDADMVQMFLDEANIAASLRHPNVARTLDVDRADGNFYLAMEFLRGANACELVQRLFATGKRLPLAHALAIVIGACRGVHYAHEMRNEEGVPLGIVHRDVSPQNIFVTYDGVPKIVDFGIAKAATSFAKTRPGALKGKLHYMSPEQCLSVNVDRRTDIFTLTIVLWELTTGIRLYPGRCDLDIMRAIVDSETRRPSSVQPGYPAALEAIVMRGLQGDVDARYQTAAELQSDLEEFAAQSQLDVGEAALARFMRDVFADELGIDELNRAPEEALADELDDNTSALQCVVVSSPRGNTAPPWSTESTEDLGDSLGAHGRRLRAIATLVFYSTLLAVICVLLIGSN